MSTDDQPVIGIWRLTLAAVEPGNFATFEIRDGLMGDTEPRLYTEDGAMTFVYKDGRRSIYFAASLLCAEYEPQKVTA